MSSEKALSVSCLEGKGLAATVWEHNGDKQVVRVRLACTGLPRPFVFGTVVPVSQAENSLNSRPFAGWWGGREVGI